MNVDTQRLLHGRHCKDVFPVIVCACALLRKLALVPSELELLRSHPKDERGEFEGGWAPHPDEPDPHFCELSPPVRWFFTSS